MEKSRDRFDSKYADIDLVSRYDGNINSHQRRANI